MAGAALNFGTVSVCALSTMSSCPKAMDGMVRQKTAENIAVSIEKLFPWVMSFVFFIDAKIQTFCDMAK